MGPEVEVEEPGGGGEIGRRLGAGCCGFRGAAVVELSFARESMVSPLAESCMISVFSSALASCENAIRWLFGGRNRG